MKGTISKNARMILNDPKASEELMNYVLNGDRKTPKEIKVGEKTFIVKSSTSEIK